MQLKHYTGPKRVNPPSLKSTVDVGVAFKSAAEKSLKVAEKKEADYLNQLNSKDPYGWNGFNNKTAREEGKLYSPSLFMLGHLLDSPPSHPDTIMTYIDYMKQNMEDMGMKYIHILCDMQLYIPTVHIRWHNLIKYQNVFPILEACT